MAVISKGIKLYTKPVEDSAGVDYQELKNLMEIPDLGGDTEAIEITTLADSAHKYTDGIKNYGDSLVFKFLYDATLFGMFTPLADSALEAVILKWKVELPDGSTCEFEGSPSAKLDAVGVNSALTFTLSIKPTSEMKWTVVAD
jgi:hypothetical protein